MKVLICGNLAVSYRGSFLIRYLESEQINFRHYDKRKSLKKAGNSFCYKVYRKLYNYFVQIFAFFRELSLIFWADIVYILPMNNDSVLRLRLIKLFNKKLVVDFYVSEYDTYVNDRETFAAGSRKAKRLKKLDALAMRLGDKVLFLNRNEKAYYTKVVGIEQTINSSIVPLVIPERPFAVLPWFHKNTEKPTICWWGSFLNLHGLQTMIDGIKILCNKSFQASFYFFGISNQKEAHYRDLIEEKGLSDYIVLRTDLNFENGLIEFLVEQCDLALGSFGENSKAYNVLVNKIIDSCSMQIPVVTMANDAVKEFFNQKSIYMCGNKPDEIAKTIEDIITNKGKMKRVATEGKAVYLRHFSVDAFSERMNNLFNSI